MSTDQGICCTCSGALYIEFNGNTSIHLLESNLVVVNEHHVVYRSPHVTTSLSNACLVSA